MERRYPCACCNSLTMSDVTRDTYEICPVCYWEDDPVQIDDLQFSGGANAVSLSEARTNFRMFGACEQRFVGLVRPPRPDEVDVDH